MFGPPNAPEKPVTLHWSPRPLEALKVLQSQFTTPPTPTWVTGTVLGEVG